MMGGGGCNIEVEMRKTRKREQRLLVMIVQAYCISTDEKAKKRRILLFKVLRRNDADAMFIEK